MNDKNNIYRFVEAQEHPWAGYDAALAEIKYRTMPSDYVRKAHLRKWRLVWLLGMDE